jgi:glycosyltransferase involved in cell wall biosynthesis
MQMNILFHHPLPLDKAAKSASGIRPVRMLKAFQSLGCNVDLVTGYTRERKQKILDIKQKIRKGVVYDFVYSESSTMPTILADPGHMPSHPFLDWQFFSFCNRKNIPIGLFYRDIYWLFENYGVDLNNLKRLGAKIAYRFDLWIYKRTLSKLYLPSQEMGSYIPTVDPKIFRALPPGHNSPDIVDVRASQEGRIKLFYVGGMSNHYQLHKLFSVVRDLSWVELIVCTREDEWLAERISYPSLTKNIKVVHKIGEEMEELLRQADIAVLFVKPHEYWTFASPVKLYEYLGHLKPILASEGTLSGSFVKNQGVGWTIPYDEQALKSLLEQLSSDSGMWDPVRQNLAKVASMHSWQARAQQVIEELGS